MFKASLTGALLLAATIVTHAQQAAHPPVLRDIPETETLPQDGVFDLLGVRLGSTRDEVLAKFKEIAPDADVNARTVTKGLKDNRGNSFQYAYDPGASVRLANPDGTTETIGVVFTTRLNGARAMGMTREIRYPEHAQANVPALLASIEKKYGPPSYVRRASGDIEVHYIWQNRQRVRLTPAQFGDLPVNCRISLDVPAYEYSPQRSASSPACPTQIKIEIRTGKREDLASRVEFSMIDRLRIQQSQREMDKWLLDEMNKVIKGQAGAHSPRL